MIEIMEDKGYFSEIGLHKLILMSTPVDTDINSS